MLWYKGWLETRFKLAIAAGLMVVFFIFVAMHPGLASGHGRKTAAAVAASETPAETMSTVWIFVLLAGAGITTQPALQATKGIHGSTLYTLSLPASRLRLVLTRASLGWLECSALVTALYCGTWLISPAMRESVTLFALGEYVATVLVCGSAIYSLSVLLAIFLDEQWRIWGTLIVCFAWLWLSMLGKLPEFADVFRAMDKGSVLAAHAVPWAPMGFSLGLSAVLFVVALQAARAREF